MGYFQAQTGSHPKFLVPALALALTVAAYLRPKASQSALWLFNSRLGLAIILATVITLVFCLGIAAILASLEYLFEIKIGNALYEHIWATGVTLIGPVYGLSLMPENLDEELVIHDDATLLERGISVLINYIMVPLAVIYVVILHLYALKIAWTWNLPKGQIGTMVLLFGLGGTATYLIGRPWAERGTRLLRWFQATWFWFTIVPVILLGIAVWQRLSDYGVTPERYGLVLIALWLLAMAVYMALRRQLADSRVILATLAGLLLISSFGPWSARDVSVASQMSRLIGIMESHGYLRDGRLVETIPAFGTLPSDTASGASSIVTFLRRINALDQLAPLFAGRRDDPFAGTSKPWQLARDITKQLHIDAASRRHGNRQLVTFNARSPSLVSADATAVISGPHLVIANRTPGKPEDASAVFTTISEGRLIIERGSLSWQVAASDLLAAARRQNQAKPPHGRPIRLKAAKPCCCSSIPGTGGKAVLLLVEVNGHTGANETKLTQARFCSAPGSTRSSTWAMNWCGWLRPSTGLTWKGASAKFIRTAPACRPCRPG